MDICFRAFKPEDAEFVSRLRRMDEMESLVGGSKRFVSIEREKKWIEDLILNDRQDVIYMAICEKDKEEIIGYTSISEIDYRNGKCFWSGIKIDPNYAGKGYGFQTEIIALKYIFEELRMERCKAECLEEHEVALKLMLKANFKKEGIMRHFVFKNGKYHNVILLSLLKEEYDELMTNEKVKKLFETK